MSDYITEIMENPIIPDFAYRIAQRPEHMTTRTPVELHENIWFDSLELLAQHQAPSETDSLFVLRLTTRDRLLLNEIGYGLHQNIRGHQEGTFRNDIQVGRMYEVGPATISIELLEEIPQEMRNAYLSGLVRARTTMKLVGNCDACNSLCGDTLLGYIAQHEYQ